MSTRRKAPGGWSYGNARLKACRRCGGEIPEGGRRRTFCSAECVHEWKLRTDPNYVRLKVFERDKGICALCGLDTQTLAPLNRWGRTPGARGTGHLWQADHIVPVVEGGGECGLDGFRTLCTACHKSETAKLRKRMSQARRREPEPLDRYQTALPF